MALSERLGWLLLGMIIGFVLGIIVARLRAIEEKVDAVDEHVKETQRKVSPGSSGFMRQPLGTGMLYFLALLIVFWGTVAGQLALNRVDHTQMCIKQYNIHQGRALTTRDDAIKAGTQSEINLWTRYAELYAQAKKDPKKIPQAQEALNRAIMSHRDALQETQSTRDSNPYPDPDVLVNCAEGDKDE